MALLNSFASFAWANPSEDWLFFLKLSGISSSNKTIFEAPAFNKEKALSLRVLKSFSVVIAEV